MRPTAAVPETAEPAGPICFPVENALHASKHALHASDQQFQLLVTSVIDYAIFKLDEHGRIATWNQGAERIKGYRADEIVGKHFSVFYPKVQVDRGWPEHELRMARAEGRFEDEGWRVRKDGSLFWANVVITALYDSEGRLQGFAKVTRDLTERKRAEESLREERALLEERVGQRTAELSRANDELQAEVAQRQRAEQELLELNTSLERRVAERTAEVVERSQQLRRLVIELSAAEQRERKRIALTLHDHFQQILVAAKYSLSRLRGHAQESPLAANVQMVDALIDEAIEASRTLAIDLNPPVLYDRGLRPALESLQRQFHENHGLQIVVDWAEDIEPIDQDLRIFLFQSVRELLLNVIKHGQTDEAVVQIRQPQPQLVELVVADEGAGCDSVRLTAGSDTSTGFGIFSIQQRVALLGGRFRVDTAPGRGCRVTLSLPSGPPPDPGADDSGEIPIAQPGGGNAPNDAAPHRIRVLIVDDHRIVREGIVGLLTGHADIEVVGQAENGRAAVEFARQLRPEAIVMDVSMPIMDGIDATRSIKRELPETRIIGMSMYDKQDLADAMLAAGASVYLTKSGPPETLIEALRGGSPEQSAD